MEFDFNLGVEQFLSEEEIVVKFDYGTGSTAKGGKKEFREKKSRRRTFTSLFSPAF